MVFGPIPSHFLTAKRKADGRRRCGIIARSSCGGGCGDRASTARMRAAVSVIELLVALAIVVMLATIAGAAVAASRSRQKKLATQATISKIDAIISSYYSSFASRNVEAVSAENRGAVIRAQVAGDLPETWEAVSELASSGEPLTGPQQAYVAVLLANQGRDVFDLLKLIEYGNAECLFMIVMQGGVSGCLDCRSLRLDIGDVDGDGNPEFLDAWGSPIGFILWPSELRLPVDSTERYFSTALPFDPIMPTATDGRGGLMRPLIYSAGPDREYGLAANNAAPLWQNGRLMPWANDNITNLDSEARQ